MSEIRIAIPDLDLNNALRLDGNLRNYEIGPFDDVVLDFSRMTNFDPLPMLMAGAIIKRFRYQYHDNTFSISGINGKSYAGTMGFFKYLSESISVGKSPGEATGSSNYIPITPISIRSLQERAFRDGGSIEIGDMIERASARLSRVIDRGNKELHKLLTYLVREILRNTPEHAQADEMWICGQYWPTYQLAEIAIIDEGIGVFQSITRNAAHAKYIHDRNERIPTFLAGQQSRVTVLGLIAVCGASLLFEQALYLLPFLFSDDYGKESLMTIPVGFVYMLGLTVVVFSAVVVQHAGVRFFHQNVFHAGICP